MIRSPHRGAMRPKKHETTGSGDLFRARLDQIINIRQDRLGLHRRRDRAAVQRQWPAWIATQFVIGLFLLKHEFPHERSDLSLAQAPRRQAGTSSGRELAGGTRERSAADQGFGAGHSRYYRAAQEHHLPDRCEAFARRDQGANPTGQEARCGCGNRMCASPSAPP